MKKIKIENSENSTSEIIIENNLKDNILSYLEDKKCFLITNQTIAGIYPEIINKFKKEHVIVIKDGEKYKNYKTYNFIMNKLLEAKIERKDAIVALGGGVTGDLAAFCASSILRGVELIQVPTTLLAMCDSSIGGKTGFNTKYGKNLIGSFYKAKYVLIDPSFLKTLNDYEIKCGLGEVVKYALIEKSCKNPDFFNLIEILENSNINSIMYNMEEIIHICALLKTGVVKLDEKEGGLRKILNFGHTFAHPLETLSNYKNISHGEAVALGMKIAGKVAQRSNLIDEKYYQKINFLIDKYNLADLKIKFNKKKFIELMFRDKKVENQRINLLLPVDYLQVGLFDNISVPLIEACLP